MFAEASETQGIGGGEVGMMDLNDTIRAFRCCVQIPPDCANCPEQGPGFGIECKNDVKVSVFHWLKAQEPRVLSVDDLKAVSGTTATVFVEERRGMRYSEMAFVYIERVYGEDVMFHGQKSIFGHVVKEYGKTWRCWTLEPTKKQMEEMAWKS